MIQGDLLSYRDGGPGYKAPGTSQEAAEKVSSTTANARGQILKLLWQRPPLTADEIAQEMGWTVLYCRPRVSELNKMGAIKKVGRRRNESGLNANCWTIA